MPQLICTLAAGRSPQPEPVVRCCRELGSWGDGNGARAEAISGKWSQLELCRSACAHL